MGFQDRGYSRDSHQPFMADWTAVMTIMVVNIAIWVANLVAAGQVSISDFLSLQGDLPRHLLKVWELVTYGFVHAPLDPWHLIGNMLGLWFFGRAVEDIMGRSGFDGMQTSNQALVKLVQAGLVMDEDAMAQSLKRLFGHSGRRHCAGRRLDVFCLLVSGRHDRSRGAHEHVYSPRSELLPEPLSKDRVERFRCRVGG